jgi:hypothetical protein
MRKSKLEVKSMEKSHWEAWVESLGMSPLYLMGINLAGEWERVDAGEDGIVMRIDNRNGLSIVGRGLEVSGAKLLNVSQQGWIGVFLNPEDRSRKWNFRLRSGDLVGQDEDGAKLEFGRTLSDLMDYVNSVEELDVPEKGPERAGLKDPKLVELNGNYMGAVERQIAPMVAGYRKVVIDGLALATRRNDVRGVEQMGLELVRLESLGWEEGCVIFSTVDWEGEVPLSQKGNKSKFDRDFKEKMGKLQNYYISQLERMKVEYKPAGKDTGEIQRQLDRFTTPAGTVRARYVKVQAENAVGVTHAVVSELNILGRDGEPLSQEGMKIHSVSSAQNQEGDAKNRQPKFAIDGDRQTLWHSRWKEPAARWPHWIAIDLQSEELISGIRVLPRQTWQRHGDVINWILFVSLDGETWREVARGKFPKSQDEQEFRFEK